MEDLDFKMEDLAGDMNGFAGVEVSAEQAKILDELDPEVVAAYLSEKGFNVLPAAEEGEGEQMEEGAENFDDEFTLELGDME